MEEEISVEWQKVDQYQKNQSLRIQITIAGREMNINATIPRII